MPYQLPNFNPIKSAIKVDDDQWFLSKLEYINVFKLKVFNELGHSIPIVITYDINTPSLVAGLNSYLPAGFRFSFNQFVYLDDDKYKYIDELGVVCQFENFDTNLYYDKDDPNTTLKIVNNGFEIIKLNKDHYYFNNNGYLIKIEYGKYSGNANPLTLNISRNANNSIDTIYYSCNQSDYVQFSYSNSSLTLIQYTSSGQSESVRFIYDNSGNLINIQENETRNIYSFSYSSNRLSQVYNILTAKIKEFTYYSENNVIQVRKIVHKRNGGSNTWSLEEIISVDHDNDGFITSCVIQDKNGKNKTYFLDKYHRLGEVFGSNSVSGSYRSLSNHTGHELTFPSSLTPGQETINGKQSYYSSGSTSITNIYDALEYVLYESDLSDNENPVLVLSLFVKINGNYNRVFMRVTGTNIHSEYVEIDSSKIDFFQRVDIPFYVDDTYGCSLQIQIVDPANNYSAITTSLFADPIVFVGSESITKLDTVPLVNITSVSINNTPHNIPISSRDIFLSLIDKCFSTHSKKFFYYSNGQNRLVYATNETILVNTSSGSYALSTLLSNGINNIQTTVSAKHYDTHFILNRITKTYRQNSGDFEVKTNNYVKAFINQSNYTEKELKSYSYYNQCFKLISVKEDNPSQSSSLLFHYYIYNSFNQLTEEGVHNDFNVMMLPNTYSYNSDGTLAFTSNDLSRINYGYNQKRISFIEQNVLMEKYSKTYFDIIDDDNVTDPFYRPRKIRFNEINTLNSSESQKSYHNLTHTDEDELMSVASDDSAYSFAYYESKNGITCYNGPFAFGNMYIRNSYSTVSSTKTWHFLNTTETITTTYDFYSRISTISYSSGSSYSYSYALNKETYEISPLSNITKDNDVYTEHHYDPYTGKLMSIDQYQDNELFFSKTLYAGQTYDYCFFNQSEYVMTIPLVEYKGNHSGLSSSTYLNGVLLDRFNFIYLNDGFGRRTGKTNVDSTISVSYSYETVNNNETNLLSSYTITNYDSNHNVTLQLSDSFVYSYLCVYHINETKIVNGNTYQYSNSFEYDAFNRLTKANTQSHSRTYTYDGSLLMSMNEMNVCSHSFTYNTSGQLTTLLIHPYDNSGDSSYTYTYDKLGNRTKESLNGSTIKTITYEHNLVSTISMSGTVIEMSYDKDLIRYKKTCSILTQVHEFDYAYDNKQLLSLKHSKTTYIFTPYGLIPGITTIEYFYFLYDLDGVTGFIHKESNTLEKFSYIKNALGDICFIVRDDGTPVIEYVYDEWGNVDKNVLVSSYSQLGDVNPFRFRGYVYDYETGYYYLFSRYYDPFTHTFTSVDDHSYIKPDDISGANLYCYCNYNPVMNKDEDGHSAVVGLLIGLGALALAGIGLTFSGWQFHNELLTNIGDSIISITEIITGGILIATGIGGSLGIGLLGAGIGSLTNGLVNMSNGGSFHAGWAGGELASAFYFIPWFGSSIGAFLGSVLTDFIDDKNNYKGINWSKAGWCAAISFGLSSFGNIVTNSMGNQLYSASHASLQYVLSYQSALLSISNSVINVFWPWKNEKE